MTLDLEAEYNNRARVPGHPAIIEAWAREAQAYRDAAGARHTRLAYGPSARQTLDIFSPEEITRPCPVLFVHGGYWQSLDPSFFSHMAKGLNARGIRVALAGYDLCPAVSIGTITEQMILAAAHLFRVCNHPVFPVGHSAGGHLAACLAATDWQDVDASYPLHLAPKAMALSGLFELEPLVPTSINHRLGLDIAAARTYSPRLWMPPSGITFDAWVGEDESAEYHRQSQTLVAAWTAAGNAMHYGSVPDANHFTILADLADPQSLLVRRLMTMITA